LSPETFAKVAEELAMLDGAGETLSADLVLAGKTTPVFFGSSLNNFGVQLLLDHFLAHAAERARARKRGGDCQFVYLDDDTAENCYQLAAQMTAEKIFETRWAAALIAAAVVRLRGELQAAGKRRLFDAVQGFLLGGEDASYQQVADRLGLSVGAIKTTIHRMRSRYRALLREEVARTVATPAEVEEELRCLRAALRG